MASHTTILSDASTSLGFCMTTIPQFGDSYEACASNELRREGGKNHVSSLMIWWFAKNEWSHPIFSELADWALNESGAVHPSQLSHIRNRKMKMMGLKVIEAFGAVNIAVYAYQEDKRKGSNRRDSLLQRLGVRTTTEQIERWIEHATVIVNPITKEPVWQADFMGMYLGYIKISGVLNGRSDFDPKRMDEMANEVGPYLADTIKNSACDIWAVVELARSVFADEQRSAKFVSVATGLDRYEGLELQRDMTELALILSEITKDTVTPDSFLSAVTAKR